MKRMSVIFVILLLIMTGCSVVKPNNNHNSIKDSYSVSEKTEKETNTIVYQEPQEIESILRKFNQKNFTITDYLAGNYIGFTCLFKNDEGIVDEEHLRNTDNNQKIELKYPDDFPEWSVASGSNIVMKNRYLYEWKSYTSQFSDSTLHDVKLTKTDGNTGEVQVVDEIEQNNPFVYLCKINDKQFLSYTVSKVPSDSTDYATETVAFLYDTDGNKKEIIREVYENDVNWTDSKGLLIERFAVKDGEIYGLGRRRIESEYKFFLYHYNLNGELIDTKQIHNFENIITSEQPVEFYLTGKFIVFRTYESLSTFICDISDFDAKIIASGPDGSMQYAVFENYIFYVENTNSLNIIDTGNGKVQKTKLDLQLNNPYFVGIKALSNGEIVLTYCDNGSYDPLKKEQFIFKSEESCAVLNDS